MRELVDGLGDAGVAPTAEAAHRVERIGARTVGRSVRLRLRRLPEPARRLASALAILERADLLQAARLADLGDDEAAEAAELLATAGILEPGRPLAFVHAIVRTGCLLGAVRDGALTGPPTRGTAARRAPGRVRARRRAPAS